MTNEHRIHAEARQAACTAGGALAQAVIVLDEWQRTGGVYALREAQDELHEAQRALRDAMRKLSHLVAHCSCREQGEVAT